MGILSFSILYTAQFENISRIALDYYLLAKSHAVQA
jgi:hypothetical protein